MAEKRKAWNGIISGFSANNLVFLDESGCNTDMTRRYAYAQGGSRAVDSAPLSKPKNTTILSSIQLDVLPLYAIDTCPQYAIIQLSKNADADQAVA